MENSNQNDKSNIVVSMLYLSGFLLPVYGIISYIAYLFGYKLRIYGVNMPSLDFISLLIVLAISAICYTVAYYLDSPSN